MTKKTRELASEVVSRLRSNGFDSHADDLEHWVHLLESGDEDERKKAAHEVRMRCHPRWLGDLNIQQQSPNEWWNCLSRLKSSL